MDTQLSLKVNRHFSEWLNLPDRWRSTFVTVSIYCILVSSRSTTLPPLALRSGVDRPVVRLLAVNKSEVEHAPEPLLGEIYFISF